MLGEPAVGDGDTPGTVMDLVDDSGPVISGEEGVEEDMSAILVDIENHYHLGSSVFTHRGHRPAPREADTSQKEHEMEKQILAEIEESEQLAHLSASHSNALVENPFD